MIRAKINVTKINKDYLFKGEKGTYLDIALIDSNSGFGDYMVVQDVPKAEREKGIKGPILGNANIVVSKKGGMPKPPAPIQTPAPTAGSADDDVPF